MSHDDTIRLPQALDYLDECEALYAVLVSAPDAAWHEPTQFKQWRFDDIVGHLLMFDYASELAARGREAVQAFLVPLATARAGGRTLTDCTREWLGDLSGPALLERWHSGYRRLAAIYRDIDPDQRLAWVGPDMSARSFMSARQMETWAHGQAVFDLLGLERRESDRLRNIAVMGINTFGWTFKVNGRPVPAIKPFVRLTAPSGAEWEWHDADAGATERIEGSAVDFCRVVTQTRHVLDTTLRVTGPVATEWMALAQCFAGPPERPPAPGTRYAARR